MTLVWKTISVARSVLLHLEQREAVVGVVAKSGVTSGRLGEGLHRLGFGRVSRRPAWGMQAVMLRLIWIVLTLALAAAPVAGAQSFAGSTWGSSPAGHMAFVAHDYDGGYNAFRLVSPSGDVSATETLVDVDDTPTVAVGARGDAIIVSIDHRERLWARYRPPGGTFGPPELVAAEASAITEGTPVAIDAAGFAVLAWGDADAALHVRVRDPAGGWGSAQRVGVRRVSRPQLAVANTGTAVLAWRQRAPSGLNSSQIAVSTRVGGSTFAPPQILAGPARHPSSAVVAINERGDAAVAWIETWKDGRFGIRAAFPGPARGSDARQRSHATRPQGPPSPSKRPAG